MYLPGYVHWIWHWDGQLIVDVFPEKSSIGEARSSSILLRPKSFDTNLMDSVTDTKNYD